MKRERRKRPGLPPLVIQLAVALRQLGASTPLVDATNTHMIAPGGKTVRLNDAKRLGDAKALLAAQFGCEVADLRLDHEPMLRIRAYRPNKNKPVAAWYSPHAHDPEWLRWRPQSAEYQQSHHVKTYVRGDHGQLSDTALANRERRRENNPDKWTVLRGLKKPKRRASKFSVNKSKMKIKSRGFPPRGSRPFNKSTAGKLRR